MKTVYKKPEIRIEHFTLSQTIADGCGATHDSTLGGPNHWTKATCGWVVGSEVYWSSIPACDDGTGEAYPEGWDGLGGICYNNPEGGASIFSS